MPRLKLIIPLFIFGINLATTNGKRIPSFAGPYTIVARHLNNETTEFTSTGKAWLRLYFTPPKPKQLQYTWGYSHVEEIVDNTSQMEIRLSQWSNNQWKRNAFVMKFDHACSAILHHAGFFTRLAHGQIYSKCPFPKFSEIRTIPNRTVDFTFPHFPVMPYNRYLFTLALIKEGEVYGVYVADVNVIPKL